MRDSSFDNMGILANDQAIHYCIPASTHDRGVALG